MTHVHTDVVKVRNRLAKIEGHTRAIRDMITQDRDCVEILHQIRSVTGAWQQVASIILEEHLRSCVASAAAEGKAEEAINSLREVIRKIM
jgi:DNA-binding FrmR family transcriptional regulator